jgi:hypothetical protein
MLSRSVCRGMIVAVALSAVASAASAADHFLTIGGGDGPSHNQVSLEKNVLYFQHVLSDLGFPATAHDIFFSCGPDGRRAVQYRADNVPKVNLLLANVLGNSDDVDVEYRKPTIPDLRGPSTRKSLSDWVANVGSRLADDDRLFIYFTGHGGQTRTARDTTLTLWNENSMDVKEFAGLLDKLPPKVQVVMVMVQCHAGGFADVIFNNAQAGPNPSALSDRHRCGFFATVPERPAAGCTPDINEDNYHEYSTYFFEAMSGQSRTGSHVDPPDFDGDGHVSFAEAHAYVQLHSDTIDIPVCTSEILLRAYSKTRMDGVDDLITPEAPFDKLTASATPAQKAVLEGLSKQLEVYGLERTDAVQQESKRVLRDKQQADGDANRAMRSFRQAREPIASALRAKWPELNTRWHPRLAKILSDEADDLVRTIETHPGYKNMEKAGERADSLSKKALDLDRRWAKCQRFLRVAEDVALSANLPKVAPPEVVERYKEMVAAEGGTLGGDVQRQGDKVTR